MASAAAEDSTLTTGISSFAFQGTNAHAIVQRLGEAIVPIVSKSLVKWSNDRVWIVPHPFVLSGSVRMILVRGKLKARLESDIFTSRMPFILDHNIQGIAIAPASLLLECAAASHFSLLSQRRGKVHINSATFSTPLLLKTEPQNFKVCIPMCWFDPMI